jgi:spore coat polysaccharide biosynthesis protein SpsF
MKKNIVLIIQARMGSTRLPGKSMMDLAGAPLVGRILERVKRSRKIDKIVLATSNLKKDDVLENLANEYQVESFRGSETDLVDRYYKCAVYYNAETVLRLPADNPCPEPDEYDKIINYHLSSNNDFSSNICHFMNNGYPDGIGVEVFTFKSLEEIWRHEKSDERREHIALNYYDYTKDEKAFGSKFSVGTIKCPVQYSRPDIILDINDLKDYKFIKKLYDELYPVSNNFGIEEIIEWYDINKKGLVHEK